MDMLVVVQGSHRGQRYPVEDDRLVLGRDRRCDIPLEDDGVSRRHAAVYRENGAIRIEDLGSTNGTYVNSLLIDGPHTLGNGDRLSVGDTVMLVEIDNPYSTAQRAVVDDSLRQSDSMMKFSLDSSSIMALMGVEEQARRPAADTGQQAFLALYGFITRVSGILDREALLERGIAEMARVCGADRGAVLLLDRQAQLVPRATYAEEENARVAVSRTLLEEVLTYREGVLSREPAKDDRFRHTQALDISRVTSMMGVPLVVQDKPLGVVYLDTAGVAQPFDEQSVRLATAMAMELAICLENANLYSMLKDSEEFSACVLESMAGGLLVVDGEGRIQRVNSAGAALAGLTPNDLLGRRLESIDPLAEISILAGQTLKSGKPQETVDARLRPEGTDAPLPVGVNTAVLRDYSGGAIGVVAHFRDLSHVHELGEQVKRAERLGALGQMASGIAHEIRNPLNSVQGFVQLLQEAVGSDEHRGYCNIVLEEVGRINRIVQEMLDFARDQAYSMERLEAGALLRRLHEQLAPEAREQGVALRCAEPSAAAPAVRANADRIKQVLMNLVRNAIQATPQDGEVTLGLETGADEATGAPRVRVFVRDTGCGIPEEELSRIFDPFYTTKDDGTGLGLSICQKIAEQHDGRLRVQSREGEGSTFTLELPAL